MSKQLDQEQIEAVVAWMKEYDQLRGTLFPVRFREAFSGKYDLGGTPVIIKSPIMVSEDCIAKKITNNSDGHITAHFGGVSVTIPPGNSYIYPDQSPDRYSHAEGLDEGRPSGMDKETAEFSRKLLAGEKKSFYPHLEHEDKDPELWEPKTNKECYSCIPGVESPYCSVEKKSGWQEAMKEHFKEEASKIGNDVYSQLNKELDSVALPTEEEWTRKRKEDLRNEVLRYVYRGKQVLEEWINELNRLNKK